MKFSKNLTKLPKFSKINFKLKICSNRQINNNNKKTKNKVKMKINFN